MVVSLNGRKKPFSTTKTLSTPPISEQELLGFSIFMSDLVSTFRSFSGCSPRDGAIYFNHFFCKTSVPPCETECCGYLRVNAEWCR